ncbi:MAG: hypothetical protein RSC93_02500 [Erysipelotrichaceae bacterium]
MNENFEKNVNYDLWGMSPQIKLMDKQIFRVDGKDKFLEVQASAMNISKIKLLLRSYDKTKQKGDKVKNDIEYYLSFEDALVLCQDILSGRLAALAKLEKKRKEQCVKEGKPAYPLPLITYEGGIPADKLAKKGKSRKDGKALFRRFNISSGDKIPFILSLEYGPGNPGKNNGVIAAYSGTSNAEAFEKLGMSAKDIKRLAVTIEMHIKAYTMAKYNLIAISQEMNYLKKEIETNIVSLLSENMVKNREYFDSIVSTLENGTLKSTPKSTPKGTPKESKNNSNEVATEYIDYSDEDLLI